MPTQPLIDRTKSVQALKSAIETFTAQVTADLEKMFRPFLEDGEEMPDLAFLQELMGRAVDAELEAIVDAEKKLDAAQAEHARHQGERDDVAESLREVLVSLNRFIAHVYGKRKLGAFKGRLPRRSAPLLRLGQSLVHRFDRPDGDWTAETTEIGRALDLSIDKAMPPIRERTLALEEATDMTIQAETRLASARIARKEAFAHFNARFPDLAHALVGLYRLSGHADLAKGFRPSGQDPGLTLTVAKRRRARRRKSPKASPAAEKKAS